MKNLLIKIYLSVVMCLLISGQIFATNYYVSTSGNNNNSGTSQNSAWRTIQKAANTMQAGDKVYIQSGTYSEDVSISQSGNANAGYISFIGQGNVVMDGQNSINIAFRNYEASYIHIENITIRDYIEEGIRFAPYNGPRIHHFRFKDLSISNTGIVQSWSNNHGLQIQETDYFLVDGVYIYNSRGNNILINRCQNGAIINSEASGTGQRTDNDEDGILIQNSQYIRIANCIANGNPEDGIDIGGEGANGDIAHISVYGCTTMNNNGEGFSFSATDSGEFDGYDVTFARCLSTGNAAGLTAYQNATDFRIVQNTFADNENYGLNMNGPISNAIVKNCVFAFQNENFSKGGLSESPNIIDIDHISWYPTGYPAWPYEPYYRGNNHLDQDPQFSGRNNGDYTLNDYSPCIDWGENLTSTTSGGSGTQISVSDAKYFSDGYYEAPGDMINVGNETVQIVDIQGNTITIDRSISWNNNTPVNFEFEGNAPDLGYIESEGTTPPPPAAELWIETLPQSVQDGILWKAEHEDNDLCEWTSCGYQYPGGGIFNDEPDEVTAEASSAIVHSGNYSAYTQITNTCEAQNPKHAVRLMRWTDAAWDNGGSLFPAETYYSTWMYLPHVYNSNKYEPWDPGDGGWWNVFQFKSKASDGASDPVFTFNIGHDDDNGEMYFYMYTKENSPSFYGQPNGYKPIPAGQWVHIEALYKASDPYTPNGEVKFWQDGELIFDVDNVITQLSERIVFGIGNYTDHVDGPEGCGTATIYFDDAIVGTEAVNPHVGATNPPPPPPSECDLIDNGDFSDNLDNWADWGCEIELQNGEALVDINSNSAGIKKGNGTLTFAEGKTYRITFDARAQSGRNMKVKATLDYSPYDLYFQEEVALTTSMQSYELSFTMNQYSAASALEFNFGGHMSNVYLDNVQVSEVDCGTTPPPASPEGDLSIRYIQRLPEIEYIQNGTNPAVEGWPLVGQQVIWRATVKHWGTSTATFDYSWYLDGAEVASGTTSVDEGQEVDIDYTRNWSFDRRELKLVIDTGNDFEEDEEGNNEVSIFTDALSTGFYVEQGVYDYFHQHQNQLGVGSNNFEDWAHRQVEIWNDMFADAVTADTPNGVLDRIRLDKITVVPDGGLPLAGGSPGYPTNLPAIDKTIDLIWGFPTDYYLNVNSQTFSDHTDATLSNPFYFDRGLFHELGHARYLIDVYGFNIEYEGGQTIDIQENGVDIDDAGLFPMPYRTDMPGLMNNSGGYTQIDAYSTMALNLIEGRRAVCGNNNPPCNLGSQPDGFMQDLPAQNRILITDIDGQPLTNANVQIYQSATGSNEWYGKRFDNTPDTTLTTDQNGYIYVGNNPFSNGVITHTFGHSNAVVIIRIEKDNNVAYKVFESWRLNMEYWRGNTQLGTYTLESGLEGGTTPPPPPPAECDLIGNGDFSDNLNQWSDWGCEMELQNGEALVDISSNSAGIKKGNGTLTFEEGKTYRITFDARAQSGRSMKVRATLDYSPYTKYFEEQVTLTTSMQSFEMTFTMGQSSAASALEFNFYENMSNVYLDNVQVSEVDCGTTPPPPPAECDLIDNGDFSDNLNNWSDWGCEIELQNGEALVDISNNSAGIKKGNGTLTFQEGKTYRITFDARAQSGRNMKVKATLDYSPYDLYFQEEVVLTTSMQSYELTFTMGQSSAASALEFNFRGHMSNVYLDNVQVTELDCDARHDIDEANSFQATAYPNPFTGQTQLEYELFNDANVQIHLYNTMGQLVNTPVPAQTQFAGKHSVYIGKNISSGIYFCEFTVDNVRKIIKIVKGN